jgi:hypothetical protein
MLCRQTAYSGDRSNGLRKAPLACRVIRRAVDTHFISPTRRLRECQTPVSKQITKQPEPVAHSNPATARRHRLRLPPMSNARAAHSNPATARRRRPRLPPMSNARAVHSNPERANHLQSLIPSAHLRGKPGGAQVARLTPFALVLWPIAEFSIFNAKRPRIREQLPHYCAARHRFGGSYSMRRRNAYS